MTQLATLLAAVFLGTGNFSSKIVYGGFSSNKCYDRCPLSLSKICERNLIALEDSSVFE